MDHPDPSTTQQSGCAGRPAPFSVAAQRYSGSVAALAARVVTCHGRACNNAAGLEALPWTVDWT